jgi:GNAT superfamily N-acetyltransferase
MPTHRVVPAVDVADAARVVGAWHWEEWGSPGDGEQGEWTDRLRSWCRRDGMPILLVALVDGELAGSVSLVPSDMPHHEVWTRNGPWLSGLFVRQQLRGRGIGTSLVAACEERARLNDVESLLLYTSTARHMYERVGWAVISEVVYDGEPNVVMRKRIEQSVGTELTND